MMMTPVCLPCKTSSRLLNQACWHVVLAQALYCEELIDLLTFKDPETKTLRVRSRPWDWGCPWNCLEAIRNGFASHLLNARIKYIQRCGYLNPAAVYRCASACRHGPDHASASMPSSVEPVRCRHGQRMLGMAVLWNHPSQTAHAGLAHAATAA